MVESRPTQDENLVWREIDNEIVVIKDDGLVHVLNKTAARIWEMCSGEFLPDEIAAGLCERYDVTQEKAITDVRNVVAKMNEMGLLKQPDQMTDNEHSRV